VNISWEFLSQWNSSQYFCDTEHSCCKCYYGLRKHLGFRNISAGTKGLIYKTLIGPIVTYGAECWLLTKKDKLQLAVLKGKSLDFWSHPRYRSVEEKVQRRTKYSEVNKTCKTKMGRTYSTYEGE
jgi:hypothetical protein